MKISLLVLLTLILSANCRAQPGFEMVVGGSEHRIMLSGEGGFALLDTGNEGDFPHNEFRIDEARLFVEGSLGHEAYVFAELNLVTRETEDENFRIGELYLELEDVSRLWGRERQLNVRFGRMDIPFGEEYLTRDAIDNPLISHSLSDLWGIDEGLEVYGRFGRVSYALAVQNGGEPSFHDFNPDKAIVGRLAVDPNSTLHLSVSAMRTGDLDVRRDNISALWFGNGFLRAIGAPQATTTFGGRLLEGDLQLRGKTRHLYLAGGAMRFHDDDRTTDNSRRVFFYLVEGAHDFFSKGAHKLYAAARFSVISAPKGFPIVGHGAFSEYFSNSASLTNSLWRLTMGTGWRLGPYLLFKTEYTFERGRNTNGDRRNHEDFFGMEAAARF
jgi:hypothetical protein